VKVGATVEDWVSFIKKLCPVARAVTPIAQVPLSVKFTIEPFVGFTLYAVAQVPPATTVSITCVVVICPVKELPENKEAQAVPLHA
jgi:hypothetical protein